MTEYSAKEAYEDYRNAIKLFLPNNQIKTKLKYDDWRN